ncbi:MAG: SH3 domain-containing protein [Anaerolineaceae bacterium]|nr:SH3 domain-containing protein [Anaerolineaceae bacterium]
MPVQSVRLQKGNSFEELVFAQVGAALNNDRESYTLASAFYLDGGRQYDGLLISPKAVFTLEMKNVGGSVQMGLNTPLEFFDKDGRLIDAFQNRHESALDQADLQWKKLSDYFKEKYGTDSIFVQSVLVFPDGTRLDVPQVNRDFSNYHANVLFATVSELPRLVQQFRPPYPLSLDPKAQDILVRGLRDGVDKLAALEKAHIANLMPPKRPSSPPPKPSPTPTPTPLRSSYDIASQRPNRQPTPRRYEPETPITIPPPPDPPQRREWPSWLWLPLGFVAVYFLLGLITSAPVALVGAALFTFLLWIGRRKLASLTAIALFGGILLFNSINFANIISTAIETLQTVPEAANPTPSPFEVRASDEAVQPANQQKEGAELSGETAVPPTPRLRVIGNSNVRSEPDMEGSVIGTAEADTVFVILDQTADFSWYKIRLGNGTEGWIGSTRIERLSP